MIPAHILFPVDFSERATRTAPYIEAMAKRFDSKVTLLHASLADQYVATIEPYMNIQLALDTRNEELQKMLDTFTKRHLPSIKTEQVLKTGDADAVITQFAHEHGVDLIMMPSHGYGPFRSLLLGSVTAKVLHDAQCPVWTGAHMEKIAQNSHLPCDTILCAVDLDSQTETLMKWSADFARSLGAKLRFIHSIPREETWATHHFGGDLIKEIKGEANRTIGQFQKNVGLEMPVCVGLGNPGEVVREEAKRHSADLILIGRGCIKGNLGRLRTHAYSIIRQAPCPVISV